ncbi:hypothetical protein [Nocardia sp. NPDC050710]|uniref:hypothetical protein n=1 Tax=Nocardia sp. NPDC050710 TaxID=3157220 RepID=UPI0034013AB0
MTDLVIRDVDIIDGTGAPHFRGDVAIDRGRISRITAPGALTDGARHHRSLARRRAGPGLH